MQEETGLDFPLIEANAEDVPLPGCDRFDLAVSEYGASLWCDPYRWIPEARGSSVPAVDSSSCTNSPLNILCAVEEPDSTIARRSSVHSVGIHRLDWSDGGVEFHLGHGECSGSSATAGFDVERLDRAVCSRRCRDHPYYDGGDRRLGAEVAVRGDLGSAQDVLTLASTSPQRRAILEQLRIPFEVFAPDYVEHDPPDADPVELVRRHAEGKARSIHADGRVTLGVDTTVLLDGRLYGKPADRDDAARMLGELSGRTHTVVSGLCLLGAGDEVVAHESTDVTFRVLTPELVAEYVASGEWEGRAGAYAIQGLGGRLVERIEGDYLNVVGLPGALLVSILERRAPKLLQTRR